jgi:hypothetical protein
MKNVAYIINLCIGGFVGFLIGQYILTLDVATEAAASMFNSLTILGICIILFAFIAVKFSIISRCLFLFSVMCPVIGTIWGLEAFFFFIGVPKPVDVSGSILKNAPFYMSDQHILNLLIAMTLFLVGLLASMVSFAMKQRQGLSTFFGGIGLLLSPVTSAIRKFSGVAVLLAVGVFVKSMWETGNVATSLLVSIAALVAILAIPVIYFIFRAHSAELDKIVRDMEMYRYRNHSGGGE